MTASDQLLLASDGRPARKSGAYAKDKLTYVRRYMTIFATGMKSNWKHRVYLDLMAGPGLCKVRRTGEEFPGSPLISFDALFTRRIFVEQDPDLVFALRARVGNRQCDIIEGDCNNFGVIQRLRDATEGADVLGLAFVDNLGLNVPFVTLSKLVTGRSIDLLIVIQLQDLRRNVRAALRGGSNRTRFNAFIGSDEWIKPAERLEARNARASEIADVIIPIYFAHFASKGHRYADQINFSIRNRMGATQYRLGLISAHALAVTFLHKISVTDPLDIF